MTDKKFSELYGFAIQIRNFKNELSALVSKDPLTYAELSKFEFLKKIRAEFPYKLPSSFDKQAIIQVLTAYKNKFDAIRHKLTFEVATFKGFGFYKRKTKKHDKGDLKKVVLDRRSTRLSVALTYLARYGSESTSVPFEIGQYKPYLRSLESMTEDERLELYKHGFKEDIESAKASVKSMFEVGKGNSYGMYHHIDWLDKHMFDYRGLIPMGLALEAPKGMYNIK